MKHKIKHILLLLGLTLALAMGSCKKDDVQSTLPVSNDIINNTSVNHTTHISPSRSDFRDSLAGRYACTTINYSGTTMTYWSDTVRDTVKVALSSPTDSALLINGNVFTYSHGLFNGYSNLPNSHNFAHFDSSGHSIYWADGCQTVSTSSGFISQGYKIH